MSLGDVPFLVFYVTYDVFYRCVDVFRRLYGGV